MDENRVFRHLQLARQVTDTSLGLLRAQQDVGRGFIHEREELHLGAHAFAMRHLPMRQLPFDRLRRGLAERVFGALDAEADRVQVLGRDLKGGQMRGQGGVFGEDAERFGHHGRTVRPAWLVVMQQRADHRRQDFPFQVPLPDGHGGGQFRRFQAVLEPVIPGADGPIAQMLSQEKFEQRIERVTPLGKVLGMPRRRDLAQTSEDAGPALARVRVHRSAADRRQRLLGRHEGHGPHDPPVLVEPIRLGQRRHLR